MSESTIVLVKTFADEKQRKLGEVPVVNDRSELHGCDNNGDLPSSHLPVLPLPPVLLLQLRDLGVTVSWLRKVMSGELPS